MCRMLDDWATEPKSESSPRIWARDAGGGIPPVMVMENVGPTKEMSKQGKGE